MYVDQDEVELELVIARIDRRELDHRPDPDAAPGWDRARQQRLIDTILRDWWVPAVVVAAPRGACDVVIDGCHRLEAITRFFRDELPCGAGGDAAPRDDELAALDGLRFSELPAAVKRRVRRFRLTMVTVGDPRSAELAELFERLDQPTSPAISAPRLPAPRRASDPPPAPPGLHRAPASAEPIYDELSAWFAEHPEGFSSPADPGDAAALVATATGTEHVTDAGLPQREPLARLVPGSIDAPADPTGEGPSEWEVGERLARHRDGVLEGRREQGHPTVDTAPAPTFDVGGGSR